MQLLDTFKLLDTAEPVEPLAAPADCLVLCKALADVSAGRTTRPLHAYLLLDRWRHNPLADALEAEFPELVAQRCSVPGDLYQGREDEAPCLVPIPAAIWPVESDGSLRQTLAHEWFAHWLHVAWNEAQGRLVRQHFGGLLFSSAGARLLAQHLARLGLQYPPPAMATDPSRGPARLFRYQDPRVMQRVWPALTPQQQAYWLGPVHAWWSLQQPWGSWTFPDAEHDAGLDASEPDLAQWFRAASPDIEAAPHTSHYATSRLFDARQWTLAHLSPVAQRIWARYLRRQISPQLQPDGDTMSRLLNEGLQHGLADADLEDFVWCSWQIEPGADQRPVRATSIDWRDARWSVLLQRVLNALRSEPDAGFAQLFEEHKIHR